MPRAAALMPMADDESTSFTTLNTHVASAASSLEQSHQEAEMAPSMQYGSASEVASAFLTNLSGGARCYEVDLGLVAKDAVTAELETAIKDIQRLMAFADTAGWKMGDSAVSDANPSSTSVVAFATNGSCDDYSTDKQEFSLSIDVTAARPITKVVVHDRVNVSGGSRLR